MTATMSPMFPNVGAAAIAAIEQINAEMQPVGVGLEAAVRRCVAIGVMGAPTTTVAGYHWHAAQAIRWMEGSATDEHRAAVADVVRLQRDWWAMGARRAAMIAASEPRLLLSALSSDGSGKTAAGTWVEITADRHVLALPPGIWACYDHSTPNPNGRDWDSAIGRLSQDLPVADGGAYRHAQVYAAGMEGHGRMRVRHVAPPSSIHPSATMAEGEQWMLASPVHRFGCDPVLAAKMLALATPAPR